MDRKYATQQVLTMPDLISLRKRQDTFFVEWLIKTSIRQSGSYRCQKSINFRVLKFSATEWTVKQYSIQNTVRTNQGT